MLWGPLNPSLCPCLLLSFLSILVVADEAWTRNISIASGEIPHQCRSRTVTICPTWRHQFMAESSRVRFQVSWYQQPVLSMRGHFLTPCSQIFPEVSFPVSEMLLDFWRIDVSRHSQYVAMRSFKGHDASKGHLLGSIHPKICCFNSTISVQPGLPMGLWNTSVWGIDGSRTGWTKVKQSGGYLSADRGLGILRLWLWIKRVRQKVTKCHGSSVCPKQCCICSVSSVLAEHKDRNYSSPQGKLAEVSRPLADGVVLRQGRQMQ